MKWLVSLAVALLPIPVSACDAGSAQPIQVRMFDDDFAATLLGTLAPFPVLLGVVAVLHADPRPTPRPPFMTPVRNSPERGGRPR